MDEKQQPPTSAGSSPSQVQEISPSLSIEWLLNRQIVLVTLKDMSRGTVNLWVDSVSPIMRDWPRSQSFRLIYNAADPRVALTPYLRTKLAEFNQFSGGLEGRVALILAKSFVGQMTQLFLRTQRHPGIETRIFFSYDEAFAWVSANIETPTH